VKTQEVVEQLVRLNADTAARFERVVQDIAGQIPAEQIEAWAEQVLAIARSGWHTWESADELLDVTPLLIQEMGGDQLLHCARFGKQLSEYSHKPSQAYFQLLSTVARRKRGQHIALLEQAALAMHDTHPHASILMVDLFAVASTQLDEPVEEFGEFTAAVSNVLKIRETASAFLSLCVDLRQPNWRFINALVKASPGACIDYMPFQARLTVLLRDVQLASLEVLLLGMTGQADFGAQLFKMMKLLVGFTALERDALISILGELPEPMYIPCILQSATSLPLQRLPVVREWLAGISRFLPLNKAAAEGYLTLESATSIESLEALLGQVNLDECQRTLQLFCEAVSGRRLRVEAHRGEVTDYRDLPGTDGLSVFLPDKINLHGSREDNYRVYKVSLLHQLGYFEFGTFNIDSEASFTAFTAHFNGFSQPRLAAALFQVIEDGRVDWALARKYRGAKLDLDRVKQQVIEYGTIAANAAEPSAGMAPALAVMTLLSLDGELTDELLTPLNIQLRDEIERLKHDDADLSTSLDVLDRCYQLIKDATSGESLQQVPVSGVSFVEELPQLVEFRGNLEPDRVRINLKLAGLDAESVDMVDDDGFSLTGIPDIENIKIENIQAGDVQGGLAVMLTDMSGMNIDAGELEAAAEDALEPYLGLLDSSAPRQDRTYVYDEWDCVIEDYRKRWCTLFEIRDMDEQPEFVEAAVRQLRDVSTRVRKQLSMLRPELLVKVRGMIDGEELDLANVIDAIVDRRMGVAPDERIYIQRQRKGRDVAALFLLDMSASTDDRIADPDEEVATAQQDPADQTEEDGKRIIDLEKEAVVMMAEALQLLGDNYAIAGFSGYGREQVEYYLCKDFDESYDLRVKGRLGGIKPCRSTRMGPAIRHATKQLIATDARVKALIILSDGYPQDFDYGKDRNSKDYGIKDTTMALSEARQKGVQPFCLTVDQSGHDYLREMCPDQQYMVIQNIHQLPDELSKVYRSLTA
jgi:hypothetical protein